MSHTCPIRPRTPPESNRVTHSRMGKLTIRCAVPSAERGERHQNLARGARSHGTRGWAQRAQLAKSFWLICSSSMELLESKRTITCSAGRHERQGTVGHIAHGGVSVDKRGQVKEERTRITDRLANVPPPTAALSSHVLHRDGEECCAAAIEAPSSGAAAESASAQTRRAAARRLPGAVASLRAHQALSREPCAEHGQHEPAAAPRKSPS